MTYDHIKIAETSWVHCVCPHKSHGSTSADGSGRIAIVWSKLMPPNVPLRPLLPSMESKFSIIIATTGNSQTMPSSRRTMICANNWPFVVSMPIFKMSLPIAPSATSQRAPASNWCMLVLAGRRQCTSHYGPVACATLRSSTIAYGTSAGGLHIEARAFQLNSCCCNTAHVHTFGCPVFALQHALASGNQLPRLLLCARLGLNHGPSLMHTRNVYLVLNLITGCVSPQYHCCFNDFFETMCNGGPDVSGTICWQQLAGLDQATHILFEMSASTPHSIMYHKTLSEDTIPL